MENLYNVQHPANFVSAGAYGIFGAVGLGANLFLIYLLVKQFTTLKAYELILLGICLVDASFCLTNVAEAYFILHSQSLGCKVTGFFNYAFGSTSMVVPCVAMLNKCSMFTYI